MHNLVGLYNFKQKLDHNGHGFFQQAESVSSASSNKINRFPKFNLMYKAICCDNIFWPEYNMM